MNLSVQPIAGFRNPLAVRLLSMALVEVVPQTTTLFFFLFLT